MLNAAPVAMSRSLQQARYFHEYSHDRYTVDVPENVDVPGIADAMPT